MGTFTPSNETSNSISLSWDYRSDIVPGMVQTVTIVQTAPNGATTTHNQTPPAAMGGPDPFSSLLPNTMYSYQLTISYMDENGFPQEAMGQTSAWTLASAPPPPPPPPPPKHATPPTNVQATAASYDTARISWGAASDFTGYNVTRVTGATSATSQIASNLSGTTTDDTISPPPPADAMFSYVVEAYNPPPGTSASATSNFITMPLQVLAIVPSSNSVVGGQPFTFAISLSGATPSPGTVVDVAASAQSLVIVHNTVPAPTGVSQLQGLVASTVAVAQSTPVTLTASLNGATVETTVKLTPLAPEAVSFTMDPIVGGASTTGYVTMNAPAPNYISIPLSSSSSSATLVGVPASGVPVQISQTQSETFSITTQPVASPTSVTITATYNGFIAYSSLGLLPLQLAGFTLSLNNVLGGKDVTGTVTLSGVAPHTAAIALGMVPLAIADLVGPAPTVAAGQTSANFTLVGVPIGGGGVPRTVTITAAYGGVSQTQTLTVKTALPTPITLASLSLYPTTIPGGGSVDGTVTLDSPAPSGGLEVGLSATIGGGPVGIVGQPHQPPATSDLASTPASVTVPKGRTSATFTVRTKSIENYSSPQYVTVQASATTVHYALLTLT
jgi:hypothetical protein